MRFLASHTSWLISTCALAALVACGSSDGDSPGSGGAGQSSGGTAASGQAGAAAGSSAGQPGAGTSGQSGAAGKGAGASGASQGGAGAGPGGAAGSGGAGASAGGASAGGASAGGASAGVAGQAGSASGGGAAGASAGGASAGGAAGSAGTAGSASGSAGSAQQQEFTVEPSDILLSITDKNVPLTQLFEAKLDGVTVSPSWTLSDYDEGTIGPDGTFTTKGAIAGETTVVATFGEKKATAKLALTLDIKEALPGAPDGIIGALDQPATAEANGSKFLYPYDGTVFPRGISAPRLQFSPGEHAPEAVKIQLTGENFSWAVYGTIANPAAPQFTLPQEAWDAALLSNASKKLFLTVTKLSGGQVYGPSTISVIAANGSLKGAVYYMSYFDPVGLYSVRPGSQEPAKQIVKGCVVCHSVSANGTHLSTGAELDATQTDYAKSGVYKVGSDGEATQLTGAPSTVGFDDQGTKVGDSRGLSHATWTPDGQFVLRARYNFWGGLQQSAWRVDDASAQLIPATVTGLDDVSALLPTVSLDGKRFAFTTGPGGTPGGTVSRSVDVMDLAIDQATSTLAFSNRHTVLDNGPGGSVTKFTAFLPDPSLLVLQEGEGYLTDYDSMLPSWDVNSTYKGATGRLHLVRLGGSGSPSEHLELLKANSGNIATDRQRNYEPFVLPVAAGSFYWVVFTSIREYGNTYQGEDARKQLWVTAIDTNAPPGTDPSHPAFYLPNQTATPNERGFWALEPCKANGLGCDAGNECCVGFCSPQDKNDPASPKACKPPEQGQCSQTGDACQSVSDCCGAAAGNLCTAGFCSEQSPKP